MTWVLRARCARAAGVAVAALTLGGCATSSEPMQIEALLGCWYFEPESAGEEARLPWGVELTADSLEGWPAVQSLGGVRRAATLTASGPRDFPIGYWRPSADGDSLNLGHPGGGGLAVDVAVPARSESEPALVGTVQPVGDVVQARASNTTRQPRPVRLTRARCP